MTMSLVSTGVPAANIVLGGTGAQRAALGLAEEVVPEGGAERDRRDSTQPHSNQLAAANVHSPSVCQGTADVSEDRANRA